MRLFQNSALYPAYQPRLKTLTAGCTTFAQRRDAFLNDRFGASHFLQPVLVGDSDAFFTNGDDVSLQSTWAREQGMPERTPLDMVLLAQIEHHRTEVFYNMDPLRYGSELVRRLPGCVRRSIAWRAAPSPGADFEAYDRVVCNFPSILRSYEERGWRAAYFAPAHDPVMDEYANRTDRDIDVLFVGGYTRHHRNRGAMLERVAALREGHRIVFCLDRSRMTRMAESPLGKLLPMKSHRRPRDIRCVSHEPVFGRALYDMLGRARIVLNGAIDMAGEDRGNMRCFEALGCGGLLLSDAGNYPEGMVTGQTLVTYGSPEEVLTRIPMMLADEALRQRIAAAGRAMVSARYSKATQWDRFQALVS